MTELPPPERRPEPLGFDPAKHRIAEPIAADAPGPTESFQRGRNQHVDLVGRVVSDRYRIRAVLGEGGMGTVYEAEHLGLGRAVAIKVLSPSQTRKRVAVKRFQQEARAAGAIGHPNICEVYDLGLLEDGSPYLVMEKLVGTTLAERILREGGLPFDEIADVMVQVLSGLIAAHEKGIVHRDVKPENVFLARRTGCGPIVKILDFGVSKIMPQFQTSAEEQLDLTRTGMVMGTPYYMSPEQARGERNLDGRVDVYACGVMMYEAIVGRRPFLAPNYNALLLSIINTTPKPIREARPSTPPALEAIVMGAMAKSRDHRYPNANALLRDIRSLALVSSSPSIRIPPPPTLEERMRAPVLGGTPRDSAAQANLHDSRPSTISTSATSATANAPTRLASLDPNEVIEQATRIDIKSKKKGPAAHNVTAPFAPGQAHAMQSLTSPMPASPASDSSMPLSPRATPGAPTTQRPAPMHTPAAMHVPQSPHAVPMRSTPSPHGPSALHAHPAHPSPSPHGPSALRAQPSSHAHAAHPAPSPSSSTPHGQPFHASPLQGPPPGSVVTDPIARTVDDDATTSLVMTPNGGPALASGEYVEEAPTEVFRHASWPHEPAAALSGSATRQVISDDAPRETRDDWDGVTAVKNPLAPPPSDARAPSHPKETLNANGEIEVEIDVDFADYTRVMKPERSG